ncbi:HEPN domain-containing protein [Candidatus Eisenbacteria bacterium]|uniref:HEPN domain-containing protein n=1 Tax=Eiseniibacteriota bacterium TaxID=2212470 RepID=A0ABV6YL03_UNCEI
MLEGLCFHAQQAAEKALKAVLIARAIPPPRTHNIGTLLDLLPADSSPSPEVRSAAILTDYAVMTRYPADAEPVEEDEYREAVRLAEIVVSWAREAIGAQ